MEALATSPCGERHDHGLEFEMAVSVPCEIIRLVGVYESGLAARNHGIHQTGRKWW